MAEILVSVSLQKLASEFFLKFGDVCGAQKDLGILRSKFLLIKDVLEDAESQSIKEKSLANWLAKLKDATYDIEDLLDSTLIEIQDHTIKKVPCFFSGSNSIIFPFKISLRVKKMRERFDEISTEMSEFHLKKREANDRKMEVEVELGTWSMFHGRDGDIETIVNFLLETNNEQEDVLIVPIVGMGGLGKTTLAQLVYNDERVKRNEHFEVRSWVYVSVVFDPKKIAEDVISSATGQSYNQDNLDYLGNELRDKRFLLVLDDVWNENPNEWEKLKPMLNVGKRGSRIIITTRSGKVASIMGNTTPYNLKGLSNDDSWKLFKQKAFGEESEDGNSRLVQIGKEIVKKWGGIPLATNALGRIMRFKREEEQWLAVRDNNNDIWKGTREWEHVLASLRLSYTHLPPPVKQCFAYCSLFPKGYEFDKETLISQWIAQGFVRSNDGSSQMEIIANAYFDELLCISFLQIFKYDICSGNVICKMLDLVHELAEFVARDKVLVEKIKKAGTGLARGCRYSALMGNISSAKFSANNFKKVRALHVFDNSDEFPGSILSSAKCLRTLDLSDYGRVKSLPKLTNLRYLRASILNVEMLLEYICGFRNLQCLYLSGCDTLRTLPKSIGHLCDLRNLKLTGCVTLQTLPKSIGDLRNLRNLKLSGCGSELQSFPNSFDKLEHLSSLDLSESNMESLPIKSFGGLQNLESINLSRCESLKELPYSIGVAKKLRSLNMAHCVRLQALPESMSTLTHLESLNLVGCRILQELPKGLGNLENLKHLGTEGCSSLRGMPRDMRKLNKLGTLPKFVVGKPEDGFSSIRELEHLNHIEGELRIENLERLRDPTDAEQANLKEKRKLNSLVLSWPLEKSDDMEVGVLECLQPPDSIKTLKIEGYRGAEYPSWLASSASLPNLASLTFQYVKRIDRLPQLEPFTSLEHLHIQGMDGILHMDAAALFPSLTELVFYDNPNLERWTTEGAATLFPRLKKLVIRGCPKLKAQPWIPASVEELRIENSSSEELLRAAASSSRLRILEITEYGASSANLQWTELRHLASSLKELSVHCSELKRLPKSIRHLASLGSLQLRGCRNFLEIPEWVGELQSLRSLYIYSCPGLTSLPNGMRHLKLDELSIIRCSELRNLPESIRDLASLQTLYLSSCYNLSEIPEWVGELQSLRSLNISYCPGLTSLPKGLGNLTSLEELHIRGCSELRCLPESIRHLTSFRSLELDDCKNLLEIGEWVGKLPLLHSLKISKCPSLTSLPNGMRQLKLNELTILGCPRLKERCERKRGKDWRVISHIPRIFMDP